MVVVLLELVAKYVPDTGATLTNPTIDFGTALAALVVLVISGSIAALIPSRRAARIKPVEALSAD